MNLDFLEGETPDVTAPVVEQAEGPSRGPDGKFVSTAAPESDPEPVVAQAGPEPEPVAPPIPEPTPPAHVPITALMDERDKRKAAEDRLRAIEAQQNRPSPPDRYEDPDAYEAHQRAIAQQQMLTVKLDLSEDMARGKHGDEVINAVQQWATAKFSQSPALQQEVLSQRNPYEYAVKLYKQEQAFQQLGDSDLDAFLAWKAQQANPSQAAAAPASVIPQQPASRPPVSLASAPSAGGAAHIPSGPGKAYERAFG